MLSFMTVTAPTSSGPVGPRKLVFRLTVWNWRIPYHMHARTHGNARMTECLSVNTHTNKNKWLWFQIQNISPKFKVLYSFVIQAFLGTLYKSCHSSFWLMRFRSQSLVWSHSSADTCQDDMTTAFYFSSMQTSRGNVFCTLARIKRWICKVCE